MYNKTIKVFAYFMLLGFLLLSCEINPKFPAGRKTGYKPIYASNEPIQFGPSRTVYNPGNIRRYKNYLLVEENKLGVHVFDNTNPEHPISIGFLKVAGNVNIGLDDNTLVVDYQNHLVCFDISNMNDIKETSRIRAWTVEVPPVTDSYYECPDPLKEIVGWDHRTLHDPKCYR